MFTKKELASRIDASILRPDVTISELKRFCTQAKKYGFHSVAVNSINVASAKAFLRGSPVRVTSTIGYPLGAVPTKVKLEEVRIAIAAGADELDVVMNIGALKSKQYDRVRKDLEAVVKAARGRIVKVIIETGLLSEEEIIAACKCVKEAGAQFVKSGTGWGPAVTVKDIKLIRKTVGPGFGVKAAGGIRTARQAFALLKAGADRLGISAAAKIVDEL
ncbi:MAG: deoxyribose-phosphate aldolase [Candidatus Woesearchaeota archaeon]